MDDRSIAMNFLSINAYRFLGGDRSEHDVERPPAENSTEWADIVKALASTCPNVFPNVPPQELLQKVQHAGGYAFINLPMGSGSLRRVHCVYFCIMRTRLFWNVLCFSYQANLHTNRIFHISPQMLYKQCCALKDDGRSTVLQLPEQIDPARHRPEWDDFSKLLPISPSRTLHYNFPNHENKELVSKMGYFSDLKNLI